ncbi:MAG: RNA polymerase sigma factor [Agathobacter sp.]
MIYLMMIDAEEDKRKFIVLYEKYRYLMMKVAFDVLGDNYLAEDAVHEAFIKIAKNMAKIGDVNSQETKRYLITITKNTTIDIYRKRSTQMKREIFVNELGENDLPLTYIETDIDNRILDILKNLPVKYRDVFLLKYSSKLDNDEIAELLNIPEGTIRQRLSRGKEIIQEAINNMEVNIDGKCESN